MTIASPWAVWDAVAKIEGKPLYRPLTSGTAAVASTETCSSMRRAAMTHEEPGDPLDFAPQAELVNHYGWPMATGENLFSTQDARSLIGYGGRGGIATGCSSTRRCRTGWSSICGGSRCFETTGGLGGA